jgi:hypothetical protein
MPYGYGRGFGFRGASPAWPYVGRGRGGLPRCWSPDVYGAPAYWPGAAEYAPYAAPWTPATPEAGRGTELEFLRQEAAAAKEALDGMEARIRELESRES